MIIGIEGPGGSGKTTMAKAVAPRIGAEVLEGGVWYRALTLLAHRQGVDLDNADWLADLARHMQLSVGSDDQVILNGSDETAAVRSPEVTAYVSKVASHLPVRDVVEKRIYDWAIQYPKVIFVGRHLGRIFPDAPILELVIDPAEAHRRQGIHENGKLASDIKARDVNDRDLHARLGLNNTARATLDVTYLTPEEQADKLLEFIRSSEVMQ